MPVSNLIIVKNNFSRDTKGFYRACLFHNYERKNCRDIPGADPCLSDPGNLIIRTSKTFIINM